MAMIAGGPHLSFTAIHELLTASTYVGVGADEEQVRICQSRMLCDPTGGNTDQKLMCEQMSEGTSTTVQAMRDSFEPGGSPAVL
jgi:hypothetical protein